MNTSTDSLSPSPTGRKDLMSDHAHQILLTQLREGHIKSGAFLSMPMLVEQMQLPIAAVREAVKRAEFSGLVSVLPKRGVLIMDAGPETTRDCLELRAMFDCEGARHRIQTPDNATLAALRDSHERLLADAQQSETPDVSGLAIKTDLSLHDFLSGGLASRLALQLYAENRDRIAIIQNTRPFLVNRIESAMQEHLDIIAAMEARDLDAAIHAIRLHLSSTLRWWGIDEQ